MLRSCVTPWLIGIGRNWTLGDVLSAQKTRWSFFASVHLSVTPLYHCCITALHNLPSTLQPNPSLIVTPNYHYHYHHHHHLRHHYHHFVNSLYWFISTEGKVLKQLLPAGNAMPPSWLNDSRHGVKIDSYSILTPWLARTHFKPLKWSCFCPGAKLYTSLSYLVAVNSSLQRIIMGSAIYGFLAAFSKHFLSVPPYGHT